METITFILICGLLFAVAFLAKHVVKCQLKIKDLSNNFDVLVKEINKLGVMRSKQIESLVKDVERLDTLYKRKADKYITELMLDLLGAKLKSVSERINKETKTTKTT